MTEKDAFLKIAEECRSGGSPAARAGRIEARLVGKRVSVSKDADGWWTVNELIDGPARAFLTVSKHASLAGAAEEAARLSGGGPGAPALRVRAGRAYETAFFTEDGETWKEEGVDREYGSFLEAFGEIFREAGESAKADAAAEELRNLTAAGCGIGEEEVPDLLFPYSRFSVAEAADAVAVARTLAGAGERKRSVTIAFLDGSIRRVTECGEGGTLESRIDEPSMTAAEAIRAEVSKGLAEEYLLIVQENERTYGFR